MRLMKRLEVLSTPAQASWNAGKLGKRDVRGVPRAYLLLHAECISCVARGMS
jgi:hypothetical protein